MAVAELKKTQTSNRKIDAKQAAKLSFDYFNELFPNNTLVNVQLEEVEFSEDENCWLITLGFDEPTPTAAWAKELFNSSTTRKFKIFKVDAKKGEVLSMHIRKVD